MIGIILSTATMIAIMLGKCDYNCNKVNLVLLPALAKLLPVSCLCPVIPGPVIYVHEVTLYLLPFTGMGLKK